MANELTERAAELAVTEEMSAEITERVFSPLTKAEKQEARQALRSEEHALALDPRVVGKLKDGGEVEDAGLSLALQMIDIDPQDEIERMLATQLIAMNGLALRATRRAHDAETLDHYRTFVNAANKASRTFADLADKLATRRGKTSQQNVEVKHVHVHEGGQAVVGNVTGGGGSPSKNREQPHE